MAAGITAKMDVEPGPDQYIPRVSLAYTPGLLSIRRLNRLQNKQEIIHTNSATDPACIEMGDGDLCSLANS